MKKILLGLMLSCFTLAMTAQDERSMDMDQWYIGIGVNTINTLGTKNPFEGVEDWAFRFPLTASVETRISDLFTVNVALNLNGFEANYPLDGAGPTDESFPYIAFDSALNYYFGKHILPRAEWLDFYVSGGLGLFIIEDANISANFGGGVLFWMNRAHSWGLKAQGLGKFAFNHSNSGEAYPNNHFQYSLQAVIKL